MHTIVPVVVYLFCYILLTAYCKPTHDVFFFTQVCLTVKAFCKNSSGICTLSLLIFQTDFCRCVSGWLLAQDICKCDAWFQFVSLLDLYSTGLSFVLLLLTERNQRYKCLSSPYLIMDYGCTWMMSCKLANWNQESNLHMSGSSSQTEAHLQKSVWKIKRLRVQIHD